MKTIKYLLLSITTMVLCLSSCKKSEENSISVDFTVQVNYPDKYKDAVVNEAEVTLTNAATGSSVKSKTNAQGAVLFVKLLPGIYKVQIAKQLSASQAFEQTGIEEEINLNRVQENVTIDQTNSSVNVQLQGSAVGSLLIKEIYYAGNINTSGTDAFYEIFNNSTDIIYADSLCIGDVVGNPYTSTSSRPSGFKKDEQHVYFRTILMIPGNGKSYPVEPGKSIVIARSAINHISDTQLGNPNAAVNLGTGIADFEVYWNLPTTIRDVDNVDVPNMKIIYSYSNTIFDWIPTVFGPSIVIFRHDNPASLTQLVEPDVNSAVTYPQLPIENVIDAVDCVANATVSNFKRLPSALDAGFQFVSKNNSGESLRRKTKSNINGRRILQDTNNSSNDFEVMTKPTPKSW